MILIMTLFGIYGPNARSYIIAIAVLYYPCLGFVNGYITARFYKFFRGKNWIECAMITSWFFPAMLIVSYICIDILEWFESNTSNLSVFKFIFYSMSWSAFNMPPTILGAFKGFNSQVIPVPVKISKMDREIPNGGCPSYLKTQTLVTFTGLILFLTIGFEVESLLTSVWTQQHYFVIFWTIYISATLFLVAVVQVAVIVNYLTLCYEDYNWWWKSFIVGASPSIYFLLASLFHLVF
mmetsp:Transcript_10423/g.7327  ORF Transcript_10423/g.7327 Transcript_10423/m.7327 type:complete len:237 (+) Transcript_10423:1053-1763(+)